MNGLRNTFLRIYLCIFNRMKKTVNRSSKYIFYFLRLIPALRKSALFDNFHINHRYKRNYKNEMLFS